ncbi:unnamed protein product [Urochloa decumbens]|uniref:Uncharacterized protein n=1 Tax=Urochloa decumbens TaxID=240449 RepID=A0ABC8X997_9POAL
MPTVSGKQTHDDDVDEEEMVRRRLLRERFMETFGPGRRCVSVSRKVRSHPCVVYTMKMSVKKARVSWCHRNSRRFPPSLSGPIYIYPITLCRAVEHDQQVEQVVHRSGGPGEPDRPGIFSGFHQPEYYIHEPYRVRGVIQKEGSSAPWIEVAVIRGMPGGRGITVTSHVKHLVLRLHDLLFLLAVPAATVDISFSERWFCLPTAWTEEGLFAEDGLHFVDIAAPLEKLARNLYDMRMQEDQEMERRRSETEEEKERRLQEEQVMRKREEERRKICKQKYEERRREEAAKPPAYPRVWDAVLGKIDGTQPAVVSSFNLSMNNSKEVLCKSIKEEGLQDMLLRAKNGDYLLPISKTTSSGSLEVLGSVEGYSALGTGAFGPKRGCFMDKSGRMLSSVSMLSQSVEKLFTIAFDADNFNILLDDGLVISGVFAVSVDIHCDDISCSELLTTDTDWRHDFLCQNIDGKVMIPFSTLLVQLKKKLQLQLTNEELELYNLSAIDAEEENEDLVEPWRKLREWIPPKPKPELPEVELHDCSLFPILSESEI